MSKPKIVTHNAGFHSDDLFAVATLLVYLKKKVEDVDIIRSRDESVIASADYVVDVGMKYDSDRNLFDHHQQGGAGERDNGIPYAAFGLVWNKFGKKICNSEKVFEAFDKKVVQPIDAGDNGFDLYNTLVKDVFPYTINSFVNSLALTWKEKGDADTNFNESLPFAVSLIKREIKVIKDWIEAQEVVEGVYQKSKTKEIIVLDKKHNFGRVLITQSLIPHKDVLFAIFYRPDHSLWQSVALNVDKKTYKVRKPFPLEWGGLRKDGLQKISAVADADFCHRSLFMCTAKSKEGAIELAKKALKA